MKHSTTLCLPLFLLLWLGGCSQPTPPAPEEPVLYGRLTGPSPTTLQLDGVSGRVVTGSFSFQNTGDASLAYTLAASAQLNIELQDPARGTLAVGETTRISVSSVCSADADGSITISSNDPDRPEVAVEVRKTCSVIPTGSFSIELEFAGTGFERYQAAFEQAARRWSSLITSDLPDGLLNKPAGVCGQGEPAYYRMVDDLLIRVIFEEMPKGILGSAGPCALRSAADGGLPIYGTIKLNTLELPNLSEAVLTATILHEMGHVLGIGTLWEHQDLLNYAGGNCNSTDKFTTQPTFTGTFAKAEYSCSTELLHSWQRPRRR